MIICDYITSLRPFGEKICQWQIFSLRPSIFANYNHKLFKNFAIAKFQIIVILAEGAGFEPARQVAPA